MFTVFYSGFRVYSLGLLNTLPPKELKIFEKERTSLQDDFWRITQETILEIDAFLGDSGINFIVLFIPDKYQVDPEYWALWAQKYRLNKREYDLLQPNRVMRDFCYDNDIYFIDATGELIDTFDGGVDPYWTIDNHLNSKGNKIVAGVVYDFYEELMSIGKGTKLLRQ